MINGSADRLIPWEGGPVAAMPGQNRGSQWSVPKSIPLWRDRNGSTGSTGNIRSSGPRPHRRNAGDPGGIQRLPWRSRSGAQSHQRRRAYLTRIFPASCTALPETLYRQPFQGYRRYPRGVGLLPKTPAQGDPMDHLTRKFQPAACTMVRLNE